MSSEARKALGIRAPADVINLAQIWEMNGARAREAICEEAEKVLRLAKLHRTSFRGVVDVVDGGKQVNEKPAEMKKNAVIDQAQSGDTKNGLKRKAAGEADGQSQTSKTAVVASGTPLSKREQKRRAKKARLEGNLATDSDGIKT